MDAFFVDVRLFVSAQQSNCWETLRPPLHYVLNLFPFQSDLVGRFCAFTKNAYLCETFTNIYKHHHHILNSSMKNLSCSLAILRSFRLWHSVK